MILRWVGRYFIWDTVDAIINFVDIGFVVHGLACLAIYLGRLYVYFSVRVRRLALAKYRV